MILSICLYISMHNVHACFYKHTHVCINMSNCRSVYVHVCFISISVHAFIVGMLLLVCPAVNANICFCLSGHVYLCSVLSVCLSEHAYVMLRLHYVPGGHGSHDFGHRGRNGVTVTQRRGTGSTNVARRGRRDHRDRFLNSQKICHGSHGAIDLLKCAVVERGERNKT